MITDYTAMLSMGRAKVLLHDGTTVEKDIVWNKDCAIDIQGKRGEFSYQRIRWDGERWRAAELYVKGTEDRAVSRLLVERFIQVVPCSSPRNRLKELALFLGQSVRSLSAANNVLELVNRRLLKLERDPRAFGRPAYTGYYSHNVFIKREDKYTDRQRDVRRLSSKRNSDLKALVSSCVNAYSNFCADFNYGSSTVLTDRRRGWTLRFRDMRVVAYNDDGNIKREVDLSPFDLTSPSFVALFGIRNAFCASIVEETGDTICLQVYSKNSKPKGYICADKNSKRHIFNQKDPGKWISLCKYSLDDIGASKAEAYARMLAKS